MINKVILVGNIGKDPDVNYIQPDVAVAKFPLATDESYKRKDGTWENRSQWHNIVAWRSSAQYVENNIRKGQLVYVEGKIQTRKYEDKNGQERYITEIVVSNLRILNKRDGSEGNFGGDTQNTAQTQQNQGNQYSAPQTPQTPQAPQAPQNPVNDDPFGGGIDDGGDDGLPF